MKQEKQEFEPVNPKYREEVQRILLAAPFVKQLGLESVEVAP
ncbi:MAG: PaaI family thioesterase, partial [Marinospirillum sp.]|nr:PaaI family thioesterase [Marinospirillum sp.]